MLSRSSGQFVDTALFSDTDALAPARGVLVGLLLSVCLWFVIGLGLWFSR
jgi:hypothetical protein